LKATVSVELDGSHFVLDEDAFAALHSYLDRAGTRLGDHPDRAEVLVRLERAIATRLGRERAGSVRPVAAEEMRATLAAVGRVDGPALDEEPRSEEEPSRSRKLYRLREHRKIAGVCAGLAAFTEIDVSLVRLAFILCTFFTGGMLMAAYVVLMFVMPVAHTPEEVAAAHGGRTAA
jgi:phage shock protein C